MFKTIRVRSIACFVGMIAILLAACSPAAPPPEELPTQADIPTVTPLPATEPSTEVQPLPEEDPEPPTAESVDEFELFTDEPLVLGVDGDGLFTVAVTGDVEANFAGVGDFSCDEGRHQLSTIAEAPGNSIYMELPAELETGEITIDSANGTNFALLIVDDVVYEAEAFGIVTFEAVPTNADEPVSGSYDMNFVGENGETVNAVGTFDLPAGDVCGG